MITSKQWVQLATQAISRNDMAIEDRAKGVLRRMDAGETAILSQELEQMMAESFNILFAPLESRTFFPVRSTTSPGADSVVYRQYERFGEAQLISDFADDLPRVNVQGTRFENPIVSFGDAYELSIQDIRAAMFAGVPLDAEMVAAARRGIEQKMNSLALTGDTTVNVKGFLNHSSIPSGAATTGTWSTATPDQIYEDCLGGIQAIRTATYRQMSPTHLLVDQSLQQYFGQRMTDTSDTTLDFLTRHTGLTVHFTQELTNEAFFYNRSPQVGWIEIPQEFEQFPPQWTNLAYVVNCHARCGGAVVPYPIAFYRMTGV